MGLVSGQTHGHGPITCRSSSSRAPWAARASTSTRPNPADHAVAGSLYSIYANIYNRVVGAKLTHGIRGVFWHQGENNSGAAAPTGDWDYKSYQQYFVDMSAAWKQDFPNLQRYIIYQVMPKPCSMGPKGDQLREVQRTLPRLFSKMNILGTLGMRRLRGLPFQPHRLPELRESDRTLGGPGFLRDRAAGARHRAQPAARLLHHHHQERNRPGIRPEHVMEQLLQGELLSGQGRRQSHLGQRLGQGRQTPIVLRRGRHRHHRLSGGQLLEL